MAKMSAKDVQALVDAERKDSLTSFQSSDIQDQRTKALDYYLGDMSKDMPTLPDRSTAVSTDVSDTVEGLMPVLMDIFTASSTLTRFKPVGPEDVEAAKQEGQYVNHLIMEENPGWMTLYTFVKDALLSKTGIVKVWWGTETEETRETYHDLSDDAFALVVADEDLEIVAHSERPAPEETPAAAQPSPTAAGAVAGGEDVASIPPPMLHDVIVAKRKEYGCLQFAPVPPEEFGISRRATSTSEATYCFHETRNKTRSELILEGFDKAQINSLTVGNSTDNEEELARDTVQESDNQPVSSPNHAAEKPRITEHYVRMDYEGDGIARLYRVVTGGDQNVVLKKGGKPVIDLVDRAPFATMTPVPMPHRFFGRSVADLVLDIQRIKTALIRAMLDNIYLANNQRLEVAEEGATRNTIDDVLDNKPGGIVRTKRVGSIAPIPNNPIGDFVMPMVQYMDATREWRTGVTRQGQGIEADTLQNQTAAAVAKVFTAAQARARLIGKIFAETGVKDFVSLVHETVRKNDDKRSVYRLRNEWVTVDPRVWRHRKDMTIEVGLGTGSKEQMLQFMFALLNIQKEGMAVPGLGMVKPKHIYNTVEKIVELGGLVGVEPFFDDPGENDLPPQQDPEAEKAQMELQIDQQKAQNDAQIAKAKADAEIRLARDKAEAELQLAREKMQAEFALRREQMIAEMQLAREQGVAKAANDREVGLEKVRMGGAVG